MRGSPHADGHSAQASKCIGPRTETSPKPLSTCATGRVCQNCYPAHRRTMVVVAQALGWHSKARPAGSGRPAPLLLATLRDARRRIAAKSKGREGAQVYEGTRSVVACGTLQPAALEAGGGLRPLFGLLLPGEADLRQIAVAAEVYSSAANRRSAEEVAATVLQAGGLARLLAEAVQLARSVAEAMPTRRGRRRRA